MSDTVPVQATSVAPSFHLVEIAAEIVASYVAHNSVPPTELPGFLSAIHAALARLGQPAAAETALALVPAVPIKKSITDDYIVCLEDGKRFKSLRRHLSTLGMTSEQYREKWGLDRSYPMVAPAYSNARSALAKEMGLGALRRKR